MLPAERRKAKLVDYYRTLWPYLNIGHDVLQLGYNVAYIFDKTSYHSPWFQLMKLNIRRVSPLDMATESAWPKEWYQRIPYALLESLRFVLPGSIFLFKLLEWWYSSASLRPSARMSSTEEILPPIKPPPSKSVPLPNAEIPKAGQCPVCNLDFGQCLSSDDKWMGVLLQMRLQACFRTSEMSSDRNCYINGGLAQ